MAYPSKIPREKQLELFLDWYHVRLDTQGLAAKYGVNLTDVARYIEKFWPKRNEVIKGDTVNEKA